MHNFSGFMLKITSLYEEEKTQNSVLQKQPRDSTAKYILLVVVFRQLFMF